MREVEEMWNRVKVRLASQRAARTNDAADGRGTLCAHNWTMVVDRDTWSGPVRVSTCSVCHALLREWGARGS